VDAVQQSIYTTEIATSAMFDGSSYLSNRCVNSVSNFYVWCFSVWVKLSDLSATNTILWSSGLSYTDSTDDDGIDFYLNSLRVYSNSGAGIASTTQKYRDTSAWYHVYGEFDSSNSSNEILLYVNNEYVGEFGNANQFEWNFNNGYRKIGAQAGGPTLKGYLADYYFIDGLALSPSAFGEYATQGTDVYWIPKDYGHDGSGDTEHWGNNGFHLKFDDPSFTYSSITYGLGKDSSGRNNHWTPSA
jgi:hypothetical protein